MCLIFFLLVFEAEKKKFYYVGLPGLGLAGGQDWQGARTWVSVSREMVGFPAPIQGDLEPANQCAPSKKPARELRSPRAPKFEKNPRRLHQ